MDQVARTWVEHIRARLVDDNDSIADVDLLYGIYTALTGADIPHPLDEPDPNQLYVACIKNGVTRHFICRIRSVNEGAGYEFVDPWLGHVVGSVGRNNLFAVAVPLNDYIQDREEDQ